MTEHVLPPSSSAATVAAMLDEVDAGRLRTILAMIERDRVLVGCACELSDYPGAGPR